MLDLLEWLRQQCSEYEMDVVAAFKRAGEHAWPLEAADEADLADQLAEGGHLLPLPKEPAALANVIEVSLVDFLLRRVDGTEGVEAQRGTERGYPDIEFTGSAFGGKHHAVDVKVARLVASGKRTQSRITLYTGNTFFRWPTLHWPGTVRAFEDYTSHVVAICLYTLDEEKLSRVSEGVEVVLQPSWRVGSRQRSSTTREYLGAVMDVEALRQGKGEFETEDEFYEYWRKYSFRIGKAVEGQLRKLLKGQPEKP